MLGGKTLSTAIIAVKRLQPEIEDTSRGSKQIMTCVKDALKAYVILKLMISIKSLEDL